MKKTFKIAIALVITLIMFQINANVVDAAYATNHAAVPDEGLKRCINTKYLNYPADVDISEYVLRNTLKNLKSLKCDDYGIKNLAGIDKLSNLSEISLNNNHITSLELLSGLKNLHGLHLVDNDVTDLSPLSGLNKLYTLSVRLNEIEDVTPLGNLPVLKHLYANGNHVTDLSSLKNIQSRGGHFNFAEQVITKPVTVGNDLNVLKIRHFDNTIVENAQAKTSDFNDGVGTFKGGWYTTTGYSGVYDVKGYLEEKNYVRDAGLRKCLNEKYLVRDESAKITIEFMRIINNLSTSIDCQGYGIKDLSTLSYLTNLKTLTLASNNISDITPLSGLTKLEKLNLNMNNITNIEGLRPLVNAKEVQLGYNTVNDANPLANMKNLQTLIMPSNRVDDISGLEKLDNLENINLSANNLYYVLPIGQMSKINQIDLTFNHITDVSQLSPISAAAANNLKITNQNIIKGFRLKNGQKKILFTVYHRSGYKWYEREEVVYGRPGDVVRFTNWWGYTNTYNLDYDIIVTII